MNRLCIIAIFISWCATLNPLSGQDIRERLKRNVETHRVFGSEHPGLYKHPASITELANGDWYIAYYGGSGEYSPDTAVYGSRRVVGETAWSPPAVIADTPFQSDGNPVIWQAPDGVVWLFYVNLDGDTWSDARVKAKISLDGAVTWSDSFVLSDEVAWCVVSPLCSTMAITCYPCIRKQGMIAKSWEATPPATFCGSTQRLKSGRRPIASIRRLAICRRKSSS